MFRRLRLPQVVAVAALLAGLSVPQSVFADGRAEAKKLSDEGLRLARQGQFATAIDKFKAADALAPTAANDCNIALAYSRLEKWARAELFVQRCKRRWVREKKTPIPAWVAGGHTNIASKLSEQKFAAFDVRTQPAGARITASTFKDDEWITSPATIYVPPGEAIISVTLDGHEGSSRNVSVVDGKPLGPTGKPLATVEFSLEEIVTEPTEKPDIPTETDPAETDPGETDIDRAGLERAKNERALLETQTDRPDGSEPSRTVALATISSGAVFVVAGGVFHALALGVKGDAEELEAGPEFDDKNSRFGVLRGAAVGLYIGGAVLAGVGTYLLLRPSGEQNDGPSVTAELGPDRVGIGLGWSFE